MTHSVFLIMASRLMRVAFLVGLLLCGIAALEGQERPVISERENVVGGTVTAADTRQPLRNAEVRISGGALKSPQTALTDAQGRYALHGIPPGHYLLSAWKLGYVRAGYGQMSPDANSKPLAVADADLTNIHFVLARAAVIVARITNELGEPVAGAFVSVLRAVVSGTDRKLVSAGGNAFIASTDDRGEVRLFNLAPGTYYVAARLTALSRLNEKRSTSPDVFYPGTLSPLEAQPIQVTAGQEFPVTLPLVTARLARITGAILSSTGAPDSESALQLLNIRSGGVTGHEIVRSGGGQFVATGVPPGTYLIQARPRTGTERPEYANHQIQVLGEDMEGIVVVTNPPATIHGRITFENGSAASGLRPEAIRITPRFLGHTVAPGRVFVAEDWTFRIRDVLGQGFLRVTELTSAWFLEGVYQDGSDITDMPLDFKALDGRGIELRLTRQRTTIIGVAGDSKGNPLSTSVVVAFPQDAARWDEYSRYIMTSRADQLGRFTLVGLPPGEYFIAAVENIDRGQEFSADFLERLRPAARRVTLQQGASQQIRLTVATDWR